MSPILSQFRQHCEVHRVYNSITPSFIILVSETLMALGRLRPPRQLHGYGCPACSDGSAPPSHERSQIIIYFFETRYQMVLNPLIHGWSRFFEKWSTQVYFLTPLLSLFSSILYPLRVYIVLIPRGREKILIVHSKSVNI